MKDNLVRLFAIVILVLIVFTYARYNALEQEVIRSELKTIAMNVQLVPALVKGVDAKLAGYAGKLSEMERSLVVSEEQKRRLMAQVDSLSAEVRELRQEKQVALANIEVKKKKR